MKSFDKDEETNLPINNILDEINSIPCVIFACNVHQDVFNVDQVREEFESIFEVFGPPEFIYLPSFRRVRVNYESPQEAARAKIALHGSEFKEQAVKVYFAQSSYEEEAATSSNLHPPALDKQFLISPPASPPVGWEPVAENKPAFNFDLLSTVIEMAPGQSHELHKGTDGAPSVVVHVCESTRPGSEAGIKKIQQTRRPGA